MSAPIHERAGLLRHPADRRQVAIVVAYLAVLAAMYLAPACRNVACLALACALSFLNAVVIHNHLHQGIFRRRGLNLAWRCVLSFGALYPASANIPAHNLVHHRFGDEGAPDWASPRAVSFRWPLLNLLHFPNVVGPDTFEGVRRWAERRGDAAFRRQYRLELAVAFGLTAALMAHDPWTTLFFVVVPQLWGARGVLRINLLQHDGCDLASEWDHSRNFTGRALNWLMCNNGFHTAHHNRAGLHWSELPAAHVREVAPRIDPRLVEPSLVAYVVRAFVLGARRPPPRSRRLEVTPDALS